MKTLGWQVVNAIALLGAITVNVAGAQNTTEAAPQVDVPTAIAAWPTVTNEAFVKQVLEMQSQQSKWDTAVVKQFREAMGQEAARRLRGADPNATGDIKYLPRLTEWATSQLTPEELRAAQQVIESQLRNKGDASIAELKAAERALGNVKGNLAKRSKLVHDWVQGRDLTPLSLDDLSWCARTMSTIRSRKNRGLHVRWTGSIVAPRDGNYAFGACPSQMVMDYTFGVSKTATRVFVDGQQVLEANGKGSKAQPVMLSASQPRAIRVEFDYEHSGNYTNPFHPPAAMLFWQGPGISKQLVPAAALTPPAEKGVGPGLWGEYSADQAPDAEGKPQPPVTIAGVDPQIDFLWTSGSSFWYRDSSAMAPVANELVRKASVTAKLKEKNGLKGIGAWLGHAELLTSAQRGQCVRALANDAELLGKLSRGKMLSVLHAYRVGTEEDAIDFIGKWAQARAASAPYPDVNYFRANRFTEFNVAAHFTYEYKGGCVRLEEEYLELPDGSCAIPAAYIVAYSRAFRGELEKWVEVLDARVADTALSGDQRASWLIARAQTEELRGYSANPRLYERPPERYHAGFGFLDEAGLVAESEAMKLRVFYEKITRCVAVRPHEVAPMLEAAKQHFTSEDAVKKLAQFEKSLQERAAADALLKVAQAKKRTAQYVKRLARRKKKAVAANDQTAVARYNALMEAAQPAPATEQP